jgi:hypothetical protein
MLTIVACVPPETRKSPMEDRFPVLKAAAWYFRREEITDEIG